MAGLLTAIGAIVGSVIPGVGTAIGAAVGGIADGLISGGSAVAGGAAQEGAIDSAVSQYGDAAKTGAARLDTGYEDSRKAKLAALAKVGALTDEQVQTAIRLIDQGQGDYVDTTIATAENYANAMTDGGASYRDALSGAGAGYAISMNDLVTQYGGEIQALADQLGVDFNTAAGLYKSGLETSAEKYSGDLVSAAENEASGLKSGAQDYAATRKEGLTGVKSALKPYAEGSGTPALDYLNKLMSADPTQLDPQQKLMREKYLRDSSARLAASSLRGSGRAGVAAVNTGDANLEANMYAQNRDRSVAAAGQLAGYGYGVAPILARAEDSTASEIASNTQSANTMGLQAVTSARNTGATYGANSRATGLQAVSSAADRAALARQVAGNDAATHTADAAKTVADQELNISKDTATNDLNISGKVAEAGKTAGTAIANQGLVSSAGKLTAVNSGYDKAAHNATKEGDINADAALGTAAADAGAIIDPAYLKAQGTIAKGAITANTIGHVGSSIGEIVKGIGGSITPSTGGGTSGSNVPSASDSVGGPPDTTDDYNY